MKFIINQVKLIEFEDGAIWWYLRDCEIPWYKRQGLMILICILPLLNHKTYKQKVNYSTNPRMWREHQIKTVRSPPATEKDVDYTAQVPHVLWIHFAKCLYTQSQQLTQLTGAFIAQNFPPLPPNHKEIKAAFPEEQVEFRTEILYKANTVLHKVTSSLDLDTLR